METSDFLVIGAGISGLLCATELQRAGRSVRVLDKGRGFGGRMATRRLAGGRLDHGAQYFTVRDPLFQNYVDEWLAAGVVREWFRKLTDSTNSAGHPRYCGSEGMTDAPKHLAKSLDVRRSEQAVRLIRNGAEWEVRTLADHSFKAGHLIITAPLPQALALLDTSGLDYAGAKRGALGQVRYQRGLATLAILDGPSGLPMPGGLMLRESPLSWIADNQIKGISPEVVAVTLHSDAEFADQHWDSPDEVRGPLMLAAAKSLIQSRVLEYSCHRWGFTRPINPWPELTFSNPNLGYTLAGDAFGGERVEGAALSGLAAAAGLLESDS
ncbi:MAG: FAD-dependent oxidoreductase [Opitutales bacterium]|nr:FAD-dependent oxidoreductase [Opitutales bacterium]